MKKILFSITTVLSLVCHSEAMLVESYKEKVNMFSPDTDLIHGHILLDGDLLKTQRFRGNIDYKYKAGEERCDGNSCSFLDKGKDSMADLLIQLFPSAGPQLNAQGTGSIESLAHKKRIDFIVGMFSIDKDVRQNKDNGEVAKMIKEITGIDDAGDTKNKDTKNKKIKDFNKKYFNLKRGSPRYQERLFRLAKDIKGAVELERDESKAFTTDAEYKENHPYPPKYTNYLICAYAWSTLRPADLDTLAKGLAERLGYAEGNDYESKLTSQISEMQSLSLVPFHAGQQIITNSVAVYKDYKFADCVETTMRQFFASLLCSAVRNEEGKFTGELTVALDRIPTSATELREFFAPNGKPADIRKLANDASFEVRKAWANVISDHQKDGISYVSTDHEMAGGWSNMVKMFCFLMQDYEATQDGPSTQKAARDRIKGINEAVKAGKFSISSSKELLEIMNDLMGIRTDIRLIAREGRDGSLKAKNGDVEGEILIYPESYEYGNVLRFLSPKRHAQLFSIPRIKPTDEAEPSTSIVTRPWIEQLYYDRELAITGRAMPYGGPEYPRMSESNYPLLDFYLRLGEDFRLEWRLTTLSEMLNTSSPHIGAIARLFFKEDSFELCLADLIKEADKIKNQDLLLDISLQVATHSKNAFDAGIAMRALNKHKPEGARDFREEISRPFSHFNIVTQRMAFGRYAETDPILEEFIKNHAPGDCFQALSDIMNFYVGSSIDVPIFSESMIEALIPHAEKAIEQSEAGEIEEAYMYGIPQLLDFINFERIDIDSPIVKAINIIKQTAKENSHFISLQHRQGRSQQKLELLLPISYVNNTTVADKIFNDYVGDITPQIAASIIMGVSENNITPILSKISKKGDAIQLIDEIILMRDTFRVRVDMINHKCARLKKILREIISHKIDKIDEQLALKLIDLSPHLTFVAVSFSDQINNIKNILFEKFDETVVTAEKSTILLTLFNLFPDEIMKDEFHDRFHLAKPCFFETFVECSEEERKAMRDPLILWISENLSKYCDPQTLPTASKILIEELKKRSIDATEKSRLIEELERELERIR